MKLRSISGWRRKLFRGILIGLFVCVVGILVLSFIIELDVKRACDVATRAYPGDKVQALMMFVKAGGHGYSARRYHANNRAVWALGQIGDQRALPLLRNLATGQPCDPETNLCQGEIKEAIQKLERDGFNLPRFLWGRILNI